MTCGSALPGDQDTAGRAVTAVDTERRPNGPRETRRTVTVLFTDLADSTGLGERLDPESVRRVIERYFGAMRDVIERHGGTVEKFIGDAIMAVFGYPTLHEDDALRAVTAADEMRTALDRLNVELERDWNVRLATRTGVNTGEVFASDPDDPSSESTFVTGDAVNVAARLEQAAQPGHVLLGPATARLIRGSASTEALAPLAVRGRSEAIAAHRLVGLGSVDRLPERRMTSPLVGRHRELRTLRDAFDRSRAASSCHLVTVLGAPGVGKSRLVREFLDSLRDGATVLRGRCLSYGEGITYRAVAETIRAGAGLADGDDAAESRRRLLEVLAGQRRADAAADGLLGALGVDGSAARAEEIAWATRRLYETLAAERPLVVVLDDLHWAEATLLDLVAGVADWSRNAPILVVGMARPDLLDVRPRWGAGKRNATTTLLEPLSTENAAQLATNLLGGSHVPEDVAGRIADAGEGNPLFVEELVAMLVDEGRLRRGGDGWVPVDDLADLVVPPSIAALISARIDRLAAGERDAIERASVVGKQFSLGALAELTAAEERPALPTHLATLVRRELIRPDVDGSPSDGGFRFRHLLVRDAAYGGMPKAERADLHERFVAWLRRTSGDRPESEETIAYHLEQAATYRSQLNPGTDRPAALARRASDLLWGVGIRARDRGDARSAVRLLSRSADLTGSGRQERTGRLVELSAAQFAVGELESAAGSAGSALADAEGRGDDVGAWHARIAALVVKDAMDPSVIDEEILAATDGARAAFTAAGDELGLSRAARLRGDVSRNRCQWAKAEAAWREALDHALASDAGREVRDLRSWIPSSLYFGPTPVVDAIRQIIEIDAAGGGPWDAARADPRVAGLLARIGRFDQARAVYRAARAERQELGLVLMVAGVSPFSADVETLAGDDAAAERELRIGIELYRAVGEGSARSTLIARRADLCVRHGRDEEAEALVAECRAIAAADDIASQALSRGVVAKLLARRGRLAEAEAAGRQAWAVLGGTDQLDLIGWTHEMLTEVLAAAKRRADALRMASAAVAAYERKGNLVGARRARVRWAELEG